MLDGIICLLNSNSVKGLIPLLCFKTGSEFVLYKTLLYLTKLQKWEALMEQTTLLVLSKTGLESIDWLLQYYAEFLFCRFFYKCLLGGGCLFHSRQIDLIEGHSPKQLSPSLPFERYLKQHIAKFKQRWIGRHKNRCRSHLLRGEDFPICSSGEKSLPAWLHIPSMHWREPVPLPRTRQVLGFL